MRVSRTIMGMPVSVEIVSGTAETLEKVFTYFMEVDERFSTYKPESEISKINRSEIKKEEASPEMQEVFELAEKTHAETHGFFSITTPSGAIDPSGLVKGWAIRNAAQLVEAIGYHNYFLDVAGDIQSKGVDANGSQWSIGIRNPFNRDEIVKVLYPKGHGVATSGTYIRGQHIYNPHEPSQKLEEVVSLTVVGPNIYEADRFATAAFAMGTQGIVFIEGLGGFEGYSIDSKGVATQTSGFEALTAV